MTEEKVNMQPKKKFKKLLLPALMLLVLALCGVVYYFVILGSHYFTTDNAKVTAKMYTITPVMSGELLEWYGQEGQKVTKGQILGRQAALPYIVSPINGTLIKNNALEKQMVSPSTQLAVVADTDNLYIGVNIEETDIMKIKVGQKATVKIDAFGNKTFQGRVTEIDQTTQTYFSNMTSFSTSGTYTKVTQLIPVKVVIENEENLPLTFGMNATVKINTKETAKDSLPADQDETGSVETGDVEAASVSTGKAAITNTNVIEAAEKIDVRPNLSGKINKIYVEVGQAVKEGDVLFELDSSDLQLQLQQSQASYNAALSSYNNTKNTYESQYGIIPLQTAYDEAAASYERMKALYEANAVSKVDLDNINDKVTTAKAQLEAAKNSAKTALDAASAQLESAEAALAIVEKKLDDCVVTAPMAGLVASRNIEVGDLASTQAAALTLIDTQRVVIRINVSETNIARVNIGDEAEVRVQAIGMVTKGKVITIAPASDPATGMFPVKIQVENPDGKLKAGMIADITLID